MTDQDDLERGTFFTRPSNPFKDLDEKREAAIVDAEDELETSDLQFKALKQDVLLRLFDSGLENDESFPASANIFVVGNRTGWFACGCQDGLIFGRTEALRTAFEEAKPNTVATLQSVGRVELPETPSHVRFSANEETLFLALPQTGILVLNIASLQQNKSLSEATVCSEQSPTILNIIPNPSQQRSTQFAYIVRQHPKCPFGYLYLYDTATEKSERLGSQREFTCMTYSHDGDIIMAGTRSGEAMYYNLDHPSSTPTRRPPPTDLPDLEGESWWIIQGVHWLDARHQLVFYNPLTHPSDPPGHQYQAYIISNTESFSPFNYTYSKFAIPPVDAFGNTDLQPWFYFQSLHAWTPQIKALTLASVTAGSDIGLVGLEPSGTWRTWSIEDESRRATVPYDMDANKETICAGMSLDFTATNKLEKVLYPDEMPGECEALPILWVCNTAGQLAGWTVIYREGVKAGERALEMKGAEVQETYWNQERETLNREVGPSDKDDRELWETEWRKAYPEGGEQTATDEPALAQASDTPSQPTVKHATPAVTTPQQTTATPTTVQTTLQKPSPTTSTSAFGKPSPPGGSPLGMAFGQPSQLGGTLPGQSGMYSGFTSTPSRPQPDIGQSSGLGTFGSSTSSSTATAPGFGKYSPQSGSGFLGVVTKPGSFLQGATSGASFLSGATGQGFQKPANQGFAKYASPSQGFGQYASPRGFGTPDSMTTPSSFAESKSFLGPTATSTKSPFGETALGSLSQRTQKYTSPSSRTPAFSDESTESEASDQDSDSEDEALAKVPVETLGLGDGGFNLSLGESRHHLAPTTPLKPDGGKTQVSPSMESVSSEGGEYVKVGLPVTPSPQAGKNITPSGTEKTTKSHLSPVAPPALAPPVTSGSSTLTLSPLAPRVIQKAVMPPDPVIAAPPPEKSVTTPQVTLPQQKPTAVEAAKPAVPISPSATNQVDLRPTAQAAQPMPVSSRSADTAVDSLLTPISRQELSDAFQLVVEQVSRELVKLFQNAEALTEYIDYQSHPTEQKSESDLSNPEDWTFADLVTLAQIVEQNTKTAESIMTSLPPIDDAIQQIEKSLKKMEPKKLELARVTQAVQDLDVRESIHSRKLAPDFARQQREIRTVLQKADEKLKALGSKVTVLKARLADERASFGVHAPTSSGIYRVINNVFSRLQILAAKVAALEKRAGDVRGKSPGAESLHSRASVPPTTPVSKSVQVARSSPRTRLSPSVRGSPLRKTMLDDKLDPWEMEEIIRNFEKEEGFRAKIADFLGGGAPLYAEASSF